MTAVVGWRDTVGTLAAGDAPTWAGASMVLAPVTVDREAARRWMPRALRPTGRGLVFIADYPETSFGIAYRESGVLLEARRRRATVLHCPWMVVDDDTALILGRELFGFPKKMASITLDVGDDAVVATVDRRGGRLLTITGGLGAAADGGDAPLPHPIVNVLGVPGPAPALLLRMDPPQVVHRERTVVHGSLAVSGGAGDPLDELGLTADGRLRWVRADLGVPPAGVRPGGVRHLATLGASAWRPIGLVSPRWLAEHLLLRCR